MVTDEESQIPYIIVSVRGWPHQNPEVQFQCMHHIQLSALRFLIRIAKLHMQASLFY